MERLVSVPAQPRMEIVDNYNTDLHRQSIHIFNPISLDNRVHELRLESRVDHLFFLVDQSPALAGEFRGVDTRFYAREMVRRFSETMPEKTYSGALLIYDQKTTAREQTLQLSTFTATDLEQALTGSDSMQQIAGQSLAMAVDQLSTLTHRIEGSSAVILVTAWSQIDKSVERAVMRLRQRNRFSGGTRIANAAEESIAWQGGQSGVCLYTVGVGNHFSQTRLETVDSCGHSVAANKVAQPRDMAHFVQTVLYRGPADSDGDGIYDYRDQCPNTASERIVDYSGCLRFAASEAGVYK